MEARKHLLKRGLWLMILEFTLVNFALFFDPGFHTVLFEVIASIGFGFIVLGLLIKLSPKLLGIIGLLIIFGHNLLALIPFSDKSLPKLVLTPFFNLNVIPLSALRVLVVGYPPIPWLGIMLVGFATGPFFYWAEERRKKLLMNIGLASILLFLLVRLVNIYGDSLPWSSQKTPILSFLSFVNVTKYPPSLVFCLITLGIMFLLLAFADRFNDGFKKIAVVYGKVPLFYFVLHLYLIHLITLLMLFLQGIHWSQMEFATGTFGRPKGTASGLPLWAIYLIWVVVVMALYKPCIWFGNYKAKHKYWWLRYI